MEKTIEPIPVFLHVYTITLPVSHICCYVDVVHSFRPHLTMMLLLTRTEEDVMMTEMNYPCLKSSHWAVMTCRGSDSWQIVEESQLKAGVMEKKTTRVVRSPEKLGLNISSWSQHKLKAASLRLSGRSLSRSSPQKVLVQKMLNADWLKIRDLTLAQFKRGISRWNNTHRWSGADSFRK